VYVLRKKLALGAHGFKLLSIDCDPHQASPSGVAGTPKRPSVDITGLLGSDAMALQPAQPDRSGP
jgi:hypothetical protein